jgi:hypothetical protein
MGGWLNQAGNSLIPCSFPSDGATKVADTGGLYKRIDSGRMAIGSTSVLLGEVMEYLPIGKLEVLLQTCLL